MEKTYPGIVEWLADQRPEVWHAIASQWNWDDDFLPLEWIAAQPECDRATAQEIFWTTSAGNDVLWNLGADLEALNDSDPYAQEMFEMIGRNAYNSFYTNSKYVSTTRKSRWHDGVVAQATEMIGKAFNEGRIDWNLTPFLTVSEGEVFSLSMLTEKEREEVEFALNGGFPD